MLQLLLCKISFAFNRNYWNVFYSCYANDDSQPAFGLINALNNKAQRKFYLNLQLYIYMYFNFKNYFNHGINPCGMGLSSVEIRSSLLLPSVEFSLNKFQKDKEGMCLTELIRCSRGEQPAPCWPLPCILMLSERTGRNVCGKRARICLGFNSELVLGCGSAVPQGRAMQFIPDSLCTAVHYIHVWLWPLRNVCPLL